MKVYKKIVYLTIGLITVLFFGGIADVFTYQNLAYYENLVKPVLDNRIIQIYNFLAYCVMAHIIGETLLKKELRHYYLLWIILLALELFSVIALYNIHNLNLTFSLHFIMVIVAITMLFSYIHTTKYLGYSMLAVTVWYIYLFMHSYAITILN